MSNSSSDDDLFLLDNVFLRLNRKGQGIHPINCNRSVYGEYHHLFEELKRDENRFFQYMRMTIETFNYILEKVEHRLIKTWCNWHKQPILPEERLNISTSIFI